MGKPIMQHAMLPVLKFTREDAERAFDEWGANCGPGAIAAISGMDLNQLRPHLGDFEGKGYVNPTLMRGVLARLASSGFIVAAHERQRNNLSWPRYGLARVQFEGPWTAPGVPIAARYRHTHWVGSVSLPGESNAIFDINAIDWGGWIPADMWAESLVPWLLKQCEPRANGKWHITHVIEVDREMGIAG